MAFDDPGMIAGVLEPVQGFAELADADDAAYATFALEGGVIAQINSSWCTRVRRDDLVVFQVDGTHGSLAGLTGCWTQARVNTPRPVWNPDAGLVPDYRADWQAVPDNQVYRAPSGSPRASAAATVPTSGVSRVATAAPAGGSRRRAANQHR